MTEIAAEVDAQQSPSLLTRRLREPRVWLSLCVIVILSALVLPPVIALIRSSIVTTSGGESVFTLKYYRAILATQDLFGVTLNSILFGLGSVVVALVLGGVMAWLVERTDTPFKGLAYATCIISMGTPFILHVVAWLYLLGRVGPLNDVYRLLTGSSGNLFEVYSLTGMILIEGVHFAPLVFLFLGSTFRAANADMEEAARMAGASVWTTILRISLRLAWPALLALSLLIFIRALEAFEVPLLVGVPGDVEVMTTKIFRSARTIPPDLGYGSAFSVLLLVFVSILFTFYGRLSRNAERYHSVTGKGFRPRPFRLGRGRYFAGTMLLLIFIFLLVLPMVAISWMSLTPYLQSMRVGAIDSLSLKNFVEVIHDPYYLRHAGNTLLLGAAVATAIMLLVLVGGWIAARRGPGGWLIDQLVTIPLIFPGIVLGVAMLQIALRFPLPIYGTLWAILIAYVIKFLPYGMRYVYSGVLQIDPELEEAAGVSGAGIFATLRRVIEPLLRPAVLAGWLFIFLICARELSIAILLASPRSEVISIVMYDLWTGGQAGELAALGLAWTALMTVVAVVFFLWSRAKGNETFAQ